MKERKGIARGRMAAMALREVLAPRRDDGIHTGDSCPKCFGRRVWVSGETLRCRDCGTRFLPDDLPPAEEESGA